MLFQNHRNVTTASSCRFEHSIEPCLFSRNARHDLCLRFFFFVDFCYIKSKVDFLAFVAFAFVSILFICTIIISLSCINETKRKNINCIISTNTQNVFVVSRHCNFVRLVAIEPALMSIWTLLPVFRRVQIVSFKPVFNHINLHTFYWYEIHDKISFIFIVYEKFGIFTVLNHKSILLFVCI